MKLLLLGELLGNTAMLEKDLVFLGFLIVILIVVQNAFKDQDFLFEGNV